MDFPTFSGTSDCKDRSKSRPRIGEVGLSIRGAAPQSRDMSAGCETLTEVNVSVKNCQILVDKLLTLEGFYTLVYFHYPCHVASFSAD